MKTFMSDHSNHSKETHASRKRKSQPPEHTKFKKGQSGNPRGRPKGRRNLATLLSEALETRIEAENRTRLEAVLARLVDGATKGEREMMFLVLKQLNRLEPRPDAPAHNCAEPLEGWLDGAHERVRRKFQRQFEIEEAWQKEEAAAALEAGEKNSN